MMTEAETNEDYLNKLRHSTTHVMAQVVQEFWPGTKLTIGPVIEDGFYYDFDSPHTFVPEDLKKIEKYIMSSFIDSKFNMCQIRLWRERLCTTGTT